MACLVCCFTTKFLFQSLDGVYIYVYICVCVCVCGVYCVAYLSVTVCIAIGLRHLSVFRPKNGKNNRMHCYRPTSSIGA